MPSDIPDVHHLLEVIAFQAQVSGSDADPAQTMQLACDHAQQVTGAAGAVIELAEGEDMVYAVCSGSLTGHVGLRLAGATSMSGLAVRTGVVQRCDDSEQDPRVDRQACRRVGLRSMLCVPLRYDGATVGVLKVIAPHTDAFGELDVAVLQLLSGVIAGAMTKAELIRRLRQEASTDALTGLPNRRRWDAALDAALARFARGGDAVTVLLLDLDNFKEINDHCGHDAGDDVLRRVAARWSRTVRSGELLARLGGDEFAVLLQAITPREVRALCTRLQRTGDARCGVSIGVAVAHPGDDAEALMRRADEAMYCRKAAVHQRAQSA